ncbi:hypothetical protein LB515_09975 [Mesorhizobium sp. CA15]|uniref:hypothetical protein n=1 Tax=Mesorhizobium sp. CA15 TaxID=2876641 RepID=UPI001CD0CE18|nr:hypothetical protein [Mesorhizobium sp. CA15]MBZ9865703.1 hypothetical protein [Mesorhizobium sp. CA15]
MAQHKTTFGGVDILRLPAAFMVMFYHCLAAVALMALSLRLDLSWPGWRPIGPMIYPLYLIHDVVGVAMLGALMRADVPYLAAIAAVGAAMIAVSWLIATEAEPRIRLLLDHSLFRYRLKAA